MRKSIIASLTFLTMMAIKASSSAQTARSAVNANVPVKEIPGFSHPESVIQSGNTLYVSNIGQAMDPAQKDGDGFISQVDLTSGKISALRFLPSEGALNAPKGMALIGRTLYAADIDHVVGFNLDNRQKVFDLPIEGTTFLNDLVAAEGKLYVSATDNGKIYEIDPSANTCHALPLKDSITGANGLYYDKNFRLLYCVTLGTWGKWDGGLYSIDLAAMDVRSISSYQGMLDGVDMAGGKLYFSDWKGMDKKGGLFQLDPQSHTVIEIALPGGGIAGPADFSISADQAWFFIPSTIEGKVYVIRR